MHVLVAYASRHGATAGIAERIAETLGAEGLRADCHPVDEVDDPTMYDAFVVGSAAYMFHWLKDATKFVRRHQALLSERPVWLFSSGPVGTDLVDDEGRDIFEASRPREFDELHELVHPYDEHVFFGAYDPDAPAKGFAEKVFKLMPVSKEALPVGDFRDWDAIDAWARDIAAHLKGEAAGPDGFAARAGG